MYSPSNLPLLLCGALPSEGVTTVNVRVGERSLVKTVVVTISDYGTLGIAVDSIALPA